MVCGSASTSTRTPRSAAVADVTGPIDTTSGCGSGSAPIRSQKFVTVDDDVNVIASTPPAAHPFEVRGVGYGRHRSVHREHLDVVAPLAQAFGEDITRDLRSGEENARSRREPARERRRAATRRRIARGRGRHGCRGAASVPAVPGPIAATRTRRERTCVEPVRLQAALEERVDPVGRGEHQPRVPLEVGSRELDRLERDRRQLDDLGAERLEPEAQFARLLPRARHDDAPAEQRAPLEPAEVEGRHRADDDRGRGLDGHVGDRRERRAPRRLVGPRAPPHGRDRRVGRQPALDQRVGDVGDAPRAHEDHECAADLRERVPVGVGRSFGGVLVPGDDRHARRQPAVRHRDARVRGRRDRARHARHDLEGNAGRDALLSFLAAAPEHERVATLQPDDLLAGGAPGDKQLVDLFLRHRDAPGRLADVDQLRTGWRERQERRRCEPVVHDDVRAAQQLLAAPGQQAGVTGPGADEVDGHAPSPVNTFSSSRRTRPPLASSRSSAAEWPTSSGSRPATRVRSTMWPSRRREQRVEDDLAVAADGRQRSDRKVAPAAELGRGSARSVSTAT